jgi:hypothetical protein
MTNSKKIKTFVIAPSDLTFLFDQCRRCFYRKVALGIRPPRSPMPKVFTLLDRSQRRYFEGRAASELEPKLPGGTVECGELTVLSVPIEIPGTNVAFVIQGSLDALITFANGGYGIVDFKTIVPKETLGEFYGRQLHAYALAAENPAPGKRLWGPVDVMGLLCFEPTDMVLMPGGGVAYLTTPTWIPVPRDDEGFYEFLRGVAEILDGPEPAPSLSCQWCSLRRAG